MVSVRPPSSIRINRHAPFGGVVAQGAPLVVASDAFTDANTTTLETHTATGGGTWAHHPSSAAGSATIDNNRVHNSNDTALHLYYHSWAPASPDYDVSCDIIQKSDTNLTDVGVCARLDTVATTHYLARYNNAQDVWQAYKLVAGAATQLGSDISQTLTIDQSYRLTLSLRGASLRVSVDGAVILSAIDSAITAAGRMGLRFGNASAAATGISVDNMQASA